METLPTQSSDNRDGYFTLIDFVMGLESRVLQLESDIYDMKKQNSEMRRRVDNLESSRSGVPF